MVSCLKPCSGKMIITITNNDNIRSQKFNNIMKACGESQLYVVNLNQEIAFKILCSAFENIQEKDLDLTEQSAVG